MSGTPAIYNPTVMDHFLNPRNVGEVPGANAVGEAGEPGCGDTLKLTMKIESGRITDVRFRALGCPVAIASSSVATELIKGRSVDEARRFSDKEVVAALGGLTPAKIKCSVLAAEALDAALNNYAENYGGTSCSPSEQ